MTGAEPEHAELINTLRRDGALIVPVCDIGDVKAWRSGVRRACRKAGLRIRTGLTTNGEAIWVDHIDHVVTPAQMQAAARATADYLAGIPATPHDQLVRQEQRRLLTVVPDVEQPEQQPGDPEGSQAVAELRTSDQHAIPLDIDLRDVVIEYSSRQHTWHDEDERCVQEWHASIYLTDDNGETTSDIGRMLAYVVEYASMRDPFGVLDSNTADLGHIAGTLFDGNDLVADLDEQLEPLGDAVLILDTITLQPDWRGRQLGPLFAGMAIEHLGVGCGFVAMLRFPPNSGQVFKQLSLRLSGTVRSTRD